MSLLSFWAYIWKLSNNQQYSFQNSLARLLSNFELRDTVFWIPDEIVPFGSDLKHIKVFHFHMVENKKWYIVRKVISWSIGTLWYVSTLAQRCAKLQLAHIRCQIYNRKLTYFLSSTDSNSVVNLWMKISSTTEFESVTV